MITAVPAAAFHVLAVRQVAAGSHLSQYIRWAGAIVAGLGAVEAVPDAVTWLWRGGLSALRRAYRSIASAVARLWKPRRRT